MEVIVNDNDGKAYVIRIDSMSDDCLTRNKAGVCVFEKGCEAPDMSKHKGKHIGVASGVHGGRYSRLGTGEK